mmetsp:Transcript_2702/g.9820  ORF Transcript_2702/g.9820 Transcript_2702/m.9820 type:complete len:84 (+) Transcript_2702:162-413(+)
MGKRKSSAKPPPKKKTPKLDRVFGCPFCNHDASVEVVIDKDREEAKLECRNCGAKYNTKVHNLSEPIDVYTEWIDECEELNKA